MRRRSMLAAALAACSLLMLSACGQGAPADDGQLQELRIGVVTTEGGGERLARLDQYEAYLEREIGVPVRIFNATEYAGVARAMEAGQVEMAAVGPANFATIYLNMGDKVQPILAPGDGAYFSVLYVRADSPYQTLEDLRGKTLAFADINSTSGYLIPNYLLKKEGKDPKEFFGNTIFGGGHEQAIQAVLAGQADAGVTWSSLAGDRAAGYSFGAPRLMVESGLLDMNDLRFLWQGGPLPPGPIIANTDIIPADLLEKIIAAHLKMHEEAPEAFSLMVGGESTGYARTNLEAYADIIALKRDETAARRE